MVSHDAYQAGNSPPTPGDSQIRSPQPPPLPPRRTKRSVRGRVLLWLGVGVVGLLALLLIGVWWIGEHLGHPGIKSRIQALAKDQAGLAIDYDGLEVSLSSGVRARSLTVSQPARFRSAAADFVRIADLEVRASAWALAGGSRVLDLVRVGRLDVTIVRDESGATTVSELFPSKPPASKQAAEAPSKLSQSLASLPDLIVRQIDIGAVLGRLIDLHRAGPPRVTSLASLGLHGALHSAPHSLRGTDLQVRGAPALRLEIRDANEALQYAAASLLLGVRADAAESLAIRMHSDLGQQNLLPDWAHVSELLNLDLSVLFDEHAGRTSLSVSDFRASGGMLSAAVGVDVFDADALRVLANGKASVNIERLPMQVPGLSLDALAFTLQAKQLAWQADHIAGALDWRGSLHGLAFERAGQSAQLNDTKLSGQGAFEGPSGNFSATLSSAAIVARSPAGTAKLSDLTLNLAGKTHEETGNTQRADADLVLALPTASFVSESADTVEIASLSLDTRVSGLISQLFTKLIPKLDSKLAIEHVAAVSGKQHAAVDNLSLALSGENLAQDESSGTGATGSIDSSLALPTLRIFDGVVPAAKLNARQRRKTRASSPATALAMNGLDMHVQLPLSLAQVTGKLSIASLTAHDTGLDALQLDFGLQTPLAWLPDAAGPAQARVTGHLGSVRSADHRGVIEELRLVANRFDKDRYRLELSTAAASLVTSGRKVPGRINADMRADAAPLAGTLVMSASLRGARDAAVDLKLDAGFAASDQRLRYEASLSAQKLDAFAALIYGVAPGAASVKVEGARFHASAKGDFTGVLRRDRGVLPLLAADPLLSARGQQSFELALTGLDYHAPDRSIVIPELTLQLSSVHGAAGAGSANASFSARTLQYDGDGTSLHLEGLEQKLTAKFDRAPDQGIVDVQSDLQLGSATQSIFPAYPVAGLRFDTHLQIDRLRSIFLRDFALENPIAGTELHAHGTLELRTRITGEADHKTLVGREALALEGSLKQALAPFEKIGFLSHASGSIEMPFHLESGGLLGYRLVATLQAQQVSLATADHSLDIEELNGIIPLLEEFALLPGGIVVSSGPRSSPLSETRFFDVHPFLSGKDYVTARSITLRGLQPLGPLAANVRVERSDFLIDQLQVGLNAGQIVGQVRIAYRDGDPLVRLRLDATGIRTAKSSDVFDANAALSFVPKAMTLDGKVQLIRVSRSHLLGILDVVDPFHESASANRIRQGLTFGYPKFVRFQLHDGALDTKVELGGLAKLVRIDEIKAVPLGPILERYVAPALAGYLPSSPPPTPTSVPPATAKESE